MNRIKLFVPLFIFVVLAGFFWRGLSLDPSAMPSALIDKTFPEFSLPRLQDETQMTTKSDLLGEVTLVNIWATWCVSCRVEHPYLNKLKAEGIRIVGLNYKDDSSAARKWLTDLGNPYQWNIVDKDGRLGVDLGVFGAPETYVLDKQGVIRYKHVGVVDQRVWDEKFLPVIQNL
ncbi:MAG: cytochrome c biogenesis protein CcmG/thiol:disulfide interchange protein DsbE [Cellvibrionaceae bacterium]|jgi:cytochrome c biogenesis protein CcmG/thiol:disulfide interchange protein DsbE